MYSLLDSAFYATFMQSVLYFVCMCESYFGL